MDSLAQISLRPLFPASVSDSEIAQKVETIRSKALAVHNYPCIANYRFVYSRAKRNQWYPQVLDGIANKVILDAGCCMGVEARHMMRDGAKLVMGFDLAETFIDLGFELFGDRAQSENKFFTADFFTDDFEDRVRARLNAVDPSSGGYFDVIFLGSVLHLMNQAQVATILTRVSRLVRPGTGQIIGHTLGLPVPGPLVTPEARVRSEALAQRAGDRYLHSPASLEALLRSLPCSEAHADFSAPLDMAMTAGARPDQMSPEQILVEGFIKTRGSRMMGFYAVRAAV
ncbi:putative S-adenosyl-L-methionine-dependent methyltransferase [Paratrimastix pyriformis]|uniref:S-adenosyl-L-methionine-dependent methyltransferase n=1 Tax=Paratrimastix pyriformis TaxID=342808 RepID=A0ABQ8UK66_9EUKA|nr:putative S-adenosyl-L-methionine-dependent methyltransferase [Paratrimastix pyriformis]